MLLLGGPKDRAQSRHARFFPRALLQPFALLDYLKFTMVKEATSAAINGEVIIDKK
jgi:hypothetical protein